MGLLLLLIFAFVIGIQNIHWYYSNEQRSRAELHFVASPNDHGR